MADQTFAERVAGDQPRLPPGADDARSARPIERARFKACMIGGFPPGGARGAIADVGVVGLGETSTAIREIVAAGSLPVSVDVDDRYGDVKTGAGARTVATCRLMGARAIRIEDRVEVERCGHMEGKEVVPLGRGVAHVRAAKDSSDLWSPGRTDARREYGRDAALRGAEAFIEVGADGVFVDAPTSVGDVEPVGSAFDVVQPANMLEGGPARRSSNPVRCTSSASTSSPGASRC